MTGAQRIATRRNAGTASAPIGTNTRIFGVLVALTTHLAACSSRDATTIGDDGTKFGTVRQASEAGTPGLVYSNFSQGLSFDGRRVGNPNAPGCSSGTPQSATPIAPDSITCDGGSASMSFALTSDGFTIDASQAAPAYLDNFGDPHRALTTINESVDFTVGAPGQLTFELNAAWGECHELHFRDPRTLDTRNPPSPVDSIVLSSACVAGYDSELNRQGAVDGHQVVRAKDIWSVPVTPGATLSISWRANNDEDSIAPGGRLFGDGSGRALKVTFQSCNDNGVRENAESCDGTDLGGKSCVSLGFSGGTLACRRGCVFDINGCKFATEGGTGTDAGLSGTGGSSGSGGTSAGGATGMGGATAGGATGVGGASAGGTTGSGGANANGGTGTGGGAGACSQAADPLLAAFAPSFTIPSFKKGFKVRGQGFDVELGGSIKTEGGSADTPCHAGISASADFTGCIHALSKNTCDAISLGVSGTCDFESKCTAPPKAACDLNKPTCCNGSVDASYTKSFPLPNSKVDIGPVSCDTKLEFQVGSTVKLQREWGTCNCDEGTFTATGNVIARDVAGFNGCTVTLFGKTISFDPLDVNAAVCVSLGVEGKQGCGSNVAPIGSSGVKFGVKANYDIAFIKFEPWELVSGGGINSAGELTTDVTCF